MDLGWLYRPRKHHPFFQPGQDRQDHAPLPPAGPSPQRRNAESTNYVVLPDADADPDTFNDNWPVLRIMLEGANTKLRRSEILEEWSSDYTKPHPGTLARWLDQAVERNLIKREGAGRKSAPYRYWLPEREGKFFGGGGMWL